MTLDPVRESHKRAAAARAVDYIKDGMKVGLGTGTTAEAFLDALAPRLKDGLKITGTPTSERTAVKARELGIPIEELDTLAPLDITVDGTDEADHELHLIKGGGGALTREKIVAASSARMIVIAEEAKLVDRLGRFPLPVEVVPFAHKTTSQRIADVAYGVAGTRITPTLRVKDGKPFVTDNGNLIYDCAFGTIERVPILARELSALPGVVEHGLFVRLCSTLILGGEGGVRVIERDR
jgi:ribose 5-phosphate isomerase A